MSVCLVFLFRNKYGHGATKVGPRSLRTSAGLPVLYSKEHSCAGSAGIPSLSLALVKFLLGCKHFKGLSRRKNGVKKIARSSSLSREAKVVQSYGDFPTRQNFRPTFNKLLEFSLPGPPPGGPPLICGCKGTDYPKYAPNYLTTFLEKQHFFRILENIPYYIRATT